MHLVGSYYANISWYTVHRMSKKRGGGNGILDFFFFFNSSWPVITTVLLKCPPRWYGCSTINTSSPTLTVYGTCVCRKVIRTSILSFWYLTHIKMFFSLSCRSAWLLYSYLTFLFFFFYFVLFIKWEDCKRRMKLNTITPPFTPCFPIILLSHNIVRNQFVLTFS